MHENVSNFKNFSSAAHVGTAGTNLFQLERLNFSIFMEMNTRRKIFPTKIIGLSPRGRELKPAVGRNYLVSNYWLILITHLCYLGIHIVMLYNLSYKALLLLIIVNKRCLLLIILNKRHLFVCWWSNIYILYMLQLFNFVSFLEQHSIIHPFVRAWSINISPRWQC